VSGRAASTHNVVIEVNDMAMSLIRGDSWGDFGQDTYDDHHD